MANLKTKLTTGAALGAGIAMLGLAGSVAAPAAGAGGGCANADSNIENLSKGQASAALICLFNQSRSNPVAKNGDLSRAARKHTKVMRSQQCFSHQCPGEDSLGKRVRKTGYANGGFQVGEIIAYGNDKSAEDIVQEWLNSSGHRRIIKRSKFDDVGVGISATDDVLVTAVFGSD